MNKTSNTNLIRIIGKLVILNGYEEEDFDSYDRSLIENCVREWEFYHPPVVEPVSLSGVAGAPMEAGAVGKSARKAKRV